MPLSDRIKDRRPLRTNRKPKGKIFDVASPKDDPVPRNQSGSNRKARIGAVRMLASLDCRANERFIIHHRQNDTIGSNELPEPYFQSANLPIPLLPV